MRPSILFRKRGRCQVEGSLATPLPPILAGAPASLEILETAKRGGVLLLPFSPGWLPDASGNGGLRDAGVCFRQQGQEIARPLPPRQRAREHEPLLCARHPHV